MTFVLTPETLTPELAQRIVRSLAMGGGLSLLELDDVRPGALEPTVATVREIDLRLEGDEFVAEFTAANYQVNVSAYGGIAGVIRRLARGSLPMDDPHEPKEPYSSKLCLQNQAYCYAVFKLKPRNWQFSRNEDPFTLALESIKPQEIYFSPRKADSQGRILPRDTVQDDCRIAYFIADGSNAGNYVDPFNLHLDIMTMDSDGAPSPIPIIIDPDVRYPGGSGAN